MGVYISGFTDEDFDVRESYRDIRLFFKDGKFVRATMPTGTKPYYKELKVVEVKAPHGSLVDADERLTFNMFDVENEEYSQKSMSIYEALVLWAEQTPKTVIEAEGE